MGIKRDLTGMRFGRLTAIKCIGSNHNHKNVWLCKCDCGGEKEILGNSLLSGRTRSCGCLHKETRKTAAATHGKSRTRLFWIWAGMKQRCKNTNDKYYGAKGISVCEEWSDFSEFERWALDNGYSDELTIDRIDVSKGYAPENCRWADRFTQMNNTTKNVYLEYNGERHTIAEWSRKVCISPGTIRRRILNGWSVCDALTEPQQSGAKRR